MESFVGEFEEGGEEVRSAVEWARVRALAADGISQREIAARLGINRRTVRRLIEADEPPRYSRAPTGSIIDPFEPVMRRLLDEWPEIKAPRLMEILRDDCGYAGGSIWSASGLLSCGHDGLSGRRRRPAIGRDR